MSFISQNVVEPNSVALQEVDDICAFDGGDEVGADGGKLITQRRRV